MNKIIYFVITSLLIFPLVPSAETLSTTTRRDSADEETAAYSQGEGLGLPLADPTTQRESFQNPLMNDGLKGAILVKVEHPKEVTLPTMSEDEDLEAPYADELSPREPFVRDYAMYDSYDDRLAHTPSGK